MSDATISRLSEETTAGSYFISNYPPYSFWNAEHVVEAHAALDRSPRAGAPLGIYVHIPFCRKRCHFCYFKVYTDKDSTEIDRYREEVHRRAKAEFHLLWGRDSVVHFHPATQQDRRGHEAATCVGRGRRDRVRMRARDHHGRETADPQRYGRDPSESW